jgi:excisionase family DNA binding protein
MKRPLTKRKAKVAPAVDRDRTSRALTTTSAQSWRLASNPRAPGHRRRTGGLQRYFTINAVAETLDVCTRTVRRWIANGNLVAHRVGGVVRIAEDDLGAFLAQHREG